MDEAQGRDHVAPPWTLEGEVVVAVVARGARDVRGGVGDPLPGPVLVLAANWATTPVGPYRELAVAAPTRTGLRPAWTVTTMVVDSEASQRDGRRNWGMPKQLGRLDWRPSADRPLLSWVERSVSVACGPSWRFGPALPVLAPVPLLQQRDGAPVTATARVRARARPAWVEVSAPAGDELAGLAGRHLGAHLPRVRLWLGPAEES